MASFYKADTVVDFGQTQNLYTLTLQARLLANTKTLFQEVRSGRRLSAYNVRIDS